MWSLCKQEYVTDEQKENDSSPLMALWGHSRAGVSEKCLYSVSIYHAVIEKRILKPKSLTC